MNTKFQSNSRHEQIAQHAEAYQWDPNDLNNQLMMEGAFRILLYEESTHPFALQHGQITYEEIQDRAIRRLVCGSYLRNHTLLRRVIASGEASLAVEVLTVIGRQALHWQIREYLGEPQLRKTISYDLLPESRRPTVPARQDEMELIKELIATVKLDERQVRILHWIAEGYSQAEIASMSKESEATVSRQVRKIAAKSRSARDIFF